MPNILKKENNIDTELKTFLESLENKNHVVSLDELITLLAQKKLFVTKNPAKLEELIRKLFKENPELWTMHNLIKVFELAEKINVKFIELPKEIDLEQIKNDLPASPSKRTR